jgi:tRNA (Thr-GGU) A37 N-methylase
LATFRVEKSEPARIRFRVSVLSVVCFEDEILVVTWFDRARPNVLSVHPRGNPNRAPEGVFSTRSPHRPNPIGIPQVGDASTRAAVPRRRA